MKRNNVIKSVLFVSTLVLGISCTNLDEQVLDGKDSSKAIESSEVKGILQSAYEGLRNFQGQGQMFTMDEMSTDALVGPTRGGDWDDNGKWRAFHTHEWDAANTEIRDAWNSLLVQIYNCNLVIENGSPAEIVEARFLKAFYYYNVIDLFGQAPYRELNSNLSDYPKVYTRTEGTEFIIKELEEILPSLATRTANDPSFANKDAAHFLLAKLYLNKAVFEAANPAGPYTFAAADMTKVVQNVDAISSSLSPNYWSNFAPDNNTSPELLFTSKNVVGTGGGIQSRWRMAMHYNQTPSGWNGFTTLAEYYAKFDPADPRIKYSTPEILANFGNPVGLQQGQMRNGKNKDAKGADAPGTAGNTLDLQDRNGHALFYTTTISLFAEGATLETAGVRGMKYIPDAANIEAPGNDYVLMRYSDALLMKAEAVIRGGTGSVGTIMTDIAARTGKPASAATLDGVYLERGKELWWEGWRRNDMIRFGKFLGPRELKSKTSDPKYLLYPLPTNVLYNPNIKQNPGY
jgi:hypothetical protein